MVSLPGSNPAWWYGRAIRLYFLFSLAASALWIIKVLYIDPTPLTSFQQPVRSPESTPAPPSTYSHALVDQSPSSSSEFQLQPPTREYTLAFTDHIYCINKQNRLGRKGRMHELFKYMHLDAHIFSRAQANHLDVWRDMINGGYERALVLEDDVDFELDAVPVIGKALGSLNNSVPNWDMLYVGHCSMEEDKGRVKTGFSRVHKAVHPFCTSGYVLSRRGAQKLFAYFVKNSKQTHALDVQLVALIKRKLIDAYSLHPPVIYQRRDLYPSDDGMDLKIQKLFKNSAWNQAVAFVPHLANWTDPLDSEYLDPAFKHIPSWMEDKKTVN
ncbi:hypothetical protein LPJ56_005517 [Coemansia sp. RSA 2599]|nr:hypothetical protein LPJ75_005565 [Coemansia sp. RSA 2598]KAJ1812387.1 hypothetical protein LPJ56_005517 [Coemansia sp. RSA 2599]